MSASDLLRKANAKATSSKGWFTSATSKFEEAGDLFQQAANAFKADKQFKEAGDAFAREAECRENYKDTIEAANAWWNAAKAFRKGSPDLAVQALHQTITHLKALGRWRQAADREKDIGQIYLRDLNDLRRACDSFERAGEWYAQEEAAATANSCFKDAADLHAELEEYPAAIKLYETVAGQSLASALTKYSVKEYWLKALLCALATGDSIMAKRNLATYSAKDTSFSSTREAKFAGALIDAVVAADTEAYTGAVAEFDHIAKLDDWKTSILLKIKRGIQEGPGLL